MYDYYSICNDGNVKRRDVHDLLDKYLDAGYSIEVRIIKEVPYNEKESTQYNANQLVFEEIKALLDFQKKVSAQISIMKPLNQMKRNT